MSFKTPTCSRDQYRLTKYYRKQDRPGSLFERLLGISLFLALLSPVIPSAAQNEDKEQSGNYSISVFYHGKKSEQRKFLDALGMQLQQKMPEYQFQFLDVTGLSKRDIKQHIPAASICTLSIGPVATQRVVATRSPINYFSILVSRNLLDRLHRVYERLGFYVTGIYEEQPFYRQISLAKALDDKLGEISLLLDQSDKFYLSEFQSEAKKRGLQLNYRILRPSDSPEKYISEVAGKNSFLLIQNNSQLFMQSKLAAVVLSAYYQQIKLIGSRFEDAKVGTLASIYTSPTALAIETSVELKKLCQLNQTRKPRYAKSFSVKVNHQIAENLNMKKIDHNQLSRYVTQLEQERLSDE